MKELPTEKRPYEKCIRFGAESLSDAELLAVVLRSGAEGITVLELAYELIHILDAKKGLSSLYQISVDELCQIKGIGKVKALQLKCIAELSKRIAMDRALGSEPVMGSAALVAEYCMEQLCYKDHEEVYLLCFNSKGKLLSQKQISIGTVNQSCVSPREIFLEAIKSHAAYVILVHNHPSGDPHPSNEDDDFTFRVKQAGEMIGIELMDHIIIGNHIYYSYREEYSNSGN